ncbi:MAG: hypothetical protein WC596_02505 [Candidatus Shapirobacteria bacterium]
MKDRWTRRELLLRGAALLGLLIAEEVGRRVVVGEGKTVWAEGKLPKTLEIRIPKDLVGGWIPGRHTKEGIGILEDQQRIFHPAEILTVPEMVNWRSFTAEHASQQRAQDCVPLAYTDALRTIGTVVTNGEYFKLGVPDEPTGTEIDQLHVLNPRAIEATVGSGPMMLDQGAEALDAVGICRNLLVKNYMEGGNLDPLSPEQIIEARRLIPSKTEMVFDTHIDASAEESIVKMEAAVAQGPVVLGFPWYWSFFDGNMEWRDDMLVPQEEEVSLAGHAVQAVAYDRNRVGRNGNTGAMLCRFAWDDWFPYGADPDLGIPEDAKGFIWMPYDFVRFCHRRGEWVDCWRAEYKNGREQGFWPTSPEPPVQRIFLPLVAKG